MILENFSAGYYIAADARVEPYPGDRAVVSQETYAELSTYLPPPFYGMVGGAHFEICAESAVPDDFVAVPEERRYNAHTDDVLLLSKNNGREVFSASR